MKLFQTLTSGFKEEDFFRMSLCLFSTSSSISPELKFHEQYLRKVTQGTFM